jgi:hypothetical protein
MSIDSGIGSPDQPDPRDPDDVKDLEYDAIPSFTGEGSVAGVPPQVDIGRAAAMDERVPSIRRAAARDERVPSRPEVGEEARFRNAETRPDSADPAAERMDAHDRTGSQQVSDSFHQTEARQDLADARREVADIKGDLGRIRGDETIVVVIRAEVNGLDRQLQQAQHELETGSGVSTGLAASLTIQVELAQVATRDAAETADDELRGILVQILQRLGRIGRKLLSMNLHLLPVKEWTVGRRGEWVFREGQHLGDLRQVRVRADIQSATWENSAQTSDSGSYDTTLLVSVLGVTGRVRCALGYEPHDASFGTSAWSLEEAPGSRRHHAGL